MTITPPVCYECKHFIDNIDKPQCAAFDVIPMPIWDGTNDHRQPFPGDNGIQFEPVELWTQADIDSAEKAADELGRFLDGISE